MSPRKAWIPSLLLMSAFLAPPALAARQAATGAKGKPAAPAAKLGSSPVKKVAARTTRIAATAAGPRLKKDERPFAAALERLAELEGQEGLVSSDLISALYHLEAPVRSGLAPTMPMSVRTRFYELALRGLRSRLALADRYAGHPDILSVYAEGVGDFYVLARDRGPHPGYPEEAVDDAAEQYEALLNKVVDARLGEMQALKQRARTSDPAGAIHESEQLAISLRSDLGRLTRYGFEPRRVDVEDLVRQIKAEALSYFTKGR